MSSGFDSLDPVAFDEFGAIVSEGGLDFAARRASGGESGGVLLGFLGARFPRLSDIQVEALSAAAEAGALAAKIGEPGRILSRAVSGVRAEIFNRIGTTAISRRVRTGYTVDFPDVGKRVFVTVTGEGFETEEQVAEEARRLAEQVVQQYPDKFGLSIDEQVGTPVITVNYIVPAPSRGPEDVV